MKRDDDRHVAEGSIDSVSQVEVAVDKVEETRTRIVALDPGASRQVREALEVVLSKREAALGRAMALLDEGE